MSAQLSMIEHEPKSVTPMDLIQLAYSQNAPVEQLHRLFELQLRVEANEAQKEFNSAMGVFKRNPPQINKNKLVSFGEGNRKTEYHHATLDHVVDSITPALSAVGIRHRWEVRQDQGWISVTCILSHNLGHSEQTTLQATADTSGAKNSIQAIASTVTYLQRYTLLAATGLAATDQDDDGKAAGTKMPDAELVAAIDAIKAARNEDELKRFFNPVFTKAQGLQDRASMDSLIKAKNQRLTEFRNENR